MSTIHNFIKNVINFDNLSRFPVLNSLGDLPKIKQCSVQISLKSATELSASVIDSFLFLEWLTGQRPFIKKIGFLHKNYKPLIHVVLTVNLRKNMFYNFLQYILICFSLLNQKSISVNAEVDSVSGGYIITIHDSSFFFNMPEYLYKFNESVQIKLFLDKAKVYEFLRNIWTNFFNQKKKFIN